MALLALGGLVIDGGRELNGKGRALAYAEEAARAGAQMIDVTQERAVLDPDAAVRAAADYCAAARQADPELVDCTPSIARTEDAAGNEVFQVVVATTIRTDTILRSLFGTLSQEASAQARAAPYQGILTADSGQLKSYDPQLSDPDPDDSGIGQDDGGYVGPKEVDLATCALGQTPTPEQPCIPPAACAEGQSPTVSAPCVPPCSPTVAAPCVPPCADDVDPTDPLQCFVPPECEDGQISTPEDPCRPPPPDPGGGGGGDDPGDDPGDGPGGGGGGGGGPGGGGPGGGGGGGGPEKPDDR